MCRGARVIRILEKQTIKKVYGMVFMSYFSKKVTGVGGGGSDALDKHKYLYIHVQFGEKIIIQYRQSIQL